MFPHRSTLEITKCPKLLALQQGFHTLKKLHIVDCGQFNMLIGFQFLTCLEKLSITRCRKVEGFPKALQHMISLKDLWLSNLPNLQSYPDNFGNLSLL